MGKVNLPKGWTITKLDLLTTDISYGYTAPSSATEVGPKMLRITDIQDNSVVWSEVPYCEIEEEKLEKYLLKKNDLVFARTGATVGKSFLIRSEPPKAVYASYLIRVRAASEELISMLSYFFNSQQYWQQITEFSSGIGQPNVNGTKLKELIITLPPLAEQKVIVDKLDTLLRKVKIIKNRLERIPEILKRLSQSVLTAAVNGKLTEDWRKHNNLTPPESTWVSAQEITYAFEIPKQWIGVSLGSISDRVSVGHVGKTSNFYTTEKNGIPFLRSQNVRPGEISLEGLAYITPEFHRSLKKSQLKSGDLLVVRVGANRGDACILPSMFSEVNCANIVFARPMSGLSKYLNIYFQSPISQSLLLGETVGGAQEVINTKSIESTFIALPPIEEQAEIVRRIEELLSFSGSIEQKVNTALDRVNNLTQSILAKAFCGELTAEWRAVNPELISGDNSAEALLEKIKVERETTKRQPKPKKAAIKKKTGSHMNKQPISVVDALKQAGEPLSGQQLLAAACYPRDSSTNQLETFFLDIRNALVIEKSIVKLERDEDSQDWFALAKDSQQ